MSDVIDLTWEVSDLVSWWAEGKRLRLDRWYLCTMPDKRRRLLMMTSSGVHLGDYEIACATDCYSLEWCCPGCKTWNDPIRNECTRCHGSHPNRSQEVPSTSVRAGVPGSLASPVHIAGHKGVCLKLLSGELVRVSRGLATHRDGGLHLFW